MDSRDRLLFTPFERGEEVGRAMKRDVTRYDLIVVGGAVNGMVCALLAAQQGLSVALFEAHHELGGGVRTKESTLPGFHHDVCSAVHPFGRCSPVLASLDLEKEGLEWIDAPVPAAHPLVNGEAVLLHRSVERTAEELGKGGRFYRAVMNALCQDWETLESLLLGPILRVPRFNQFPSLTRFGLLALTPATIVGRALGQRGAALWAGLAAHSLLPMEAVSSSAVACVLGALAHRVGWPVPKGGAQQISKALSGKLEAAGVEIFLNFPVKNLDALPRARCYCFDLSATQLHRMLGPRLSRSVRRSLGAYRPGPGVFKIDYALSGPVPWKDPRVSQAATIHLGGSLTEVALSERAVWKGELSEHPFLLAAQPSLFDHTRAPEGKHTFWVYLHTPNGWSGDLTKLMESEIERYAPGFRDLVLGRKIYTPASFETYNPNFVGGDILGGANTLRQIVARPRLTLDPYYLGSAYYCCSASVPPGGGVHGMAGFHAFQSLWRREFKKNGLVRDTRRPHQPTKADPV